MIKPVQVKSPNTNDKAHPPAPRKHTQTHVHKQSKLPEFKYPYPHVE